MLLAGAIVLPECFVGGVYCVCGCVRVAPGVNGADVPTGVLLCPLLPDRGVVFIHFCFQVRRLALWRCSTSIVR